MAIATDFSITAGGDIRYTGAAHGVAGAGYYTVIEFHRWLGTLADDPVASGDDILDITDTTPTDRATDNYVTLLEPFNIDQTASEHLYDGSIVQAGGDEIWDGIVNYGTEGIHIEILQDGALIADPFWNTIPDGETLKGLNRNLVQGVSHRFMVKVRDTATDIDGRRLLGMNREYLSTYGEFNIAGSSRGNNTLALTHSLDLNNETAEGTVSGWTEITNTEGYRAIDVNNDSTDEYYYSEWNKDTYSINQFFERMKWLTRRGSASTMYGLDGDIFRGITHEITYNTLTGTIDHANPVVFGNGATAQVLADNGTDTMWVQLLTGAAPSASDTIDQTAPDASDAVVATITARTLSFPFVGASTGSAIIGAYGIGIEYADLLATDKLFDLTDTQRTPPNNVTFTLGGLVNTEDYAIVGPWDGVATDSLGNPVPDEDQLSASGAYSGGETTFTVQEAIPGDTPPSGTIRVFDGDTYAKVTYTGWGNTSDFTGCSNVPACADGDDVWISYIDELAGGTSATFTGVYQSDRDLFVRVRDGGGSPIKTFITSGQLTDTGGGTTAIRTPDA